MNSNTVLLLTISLVGLQLVMGLAFPPKSSATNLIRKYGYPVEEHNNIETADGYLLDVHRIPHGLYERGGERKPAVLLVHGILGSAENWIVTGPGKGLAFVLADAGYDVWLANTRGTTHSRKHKILNPDADLNYWQFSWHEVGAYDLPAMISYVLSVTDQTQIYYVGHSQGATSFFVMASERPEFNEKIRLAIALAPTVFMSNLQNPFLQAMAKMEHWGVDWLFSMVNYGEFLPNNEIIRLADQTFCNAQAVTQDICSNILFLIAGFDSTELNKTTLPEILSASPAGASMKQMIHYAQGVNSGDFRHYDYGPIGNMRLYNSFIPPNYNLKRVSAPVALIYAQNDLLVSIRDVQKLEQELPNVIYSRLIAYSRFNHLDFLWASDVVALVYNDILELLKKY